MNWSRLAISAVVPFLVALPIAAVFWRTRHATMGTVVGAGVVLVGTLLFMAVEYGEAVQFRVMCAEQNLPCRPSDPSDFVKVFSYALVGMLEVMALFVVAAAVETRIQNRHRAPEWR